MTGALLGWLVLYASLFALSGFSLYVLRSFVQRDWSIRTLARVSSIIAFFASSAIWLSTALD